MSDDNAKGTGEDKVVLEPHSTKHAVVSDLVLAWSVLRTVSLEDINEISALIAPLNRYQWAALVQGKSLPVDFGYRGPLKAEDVAILAATDAGRRLTEWDAATSHAYDRRTVRAPAQAGARKSAATNGTIHEARLHISPPPS